MWVNTYELLVEHGAVFIPNWNTEVSGIAGTNYHQPRVAGQMMKMFGAGKSHTRTGEWLGQEGTFVWLDGYPLPNDPPKTGPAEPAGADLPAQTSH